MTYSEFCPGVIGGDVCKIIIISIVTAKSSAAATRVVITLIKQTFVQVGWKTPPVEHNAPRV